MSNSYIIKVDKLPPPSTDCAVLWVSVGGGRDFEGDRFRQVAKWASETFQELWLDIADTDKAINYETFDGYTKDRAYQIARAMGDLWLTQNAEALSYFKQNHIFRYDYWVQSAEYSSIRNKIQSLFDKSDTFRSAVLNEAQEYIIKKSSLPTIKQRDASVEYILNEISASSVRAKKLQATCLYPGKQKESFRLIRDKVIYGAPEYLSYEPYLALTVRRNNGNKTSKTA